MTRPEPDLKLRTARTIKWNVVDKVSSQLLYAVTGIVLARVLSQEDFGLVGAIMVFQAFAQMFIDSGFSSALVQRKSPAEEDYSTVMWFNIGMAATVYVILWVAAPWIADIFQGDRRLIPLSRIMFLTFVLHSTSIVQVSRLMKRMDVRMIAVANVIALVASAFVGISLAVGGWGAWAIVWQSLTMAAVKSAVLWGTGRWMPMMVFSWRSLKSFFKVGSGVMFSSFLNVLFQNIYSFFIGNRVGLAGLGYYTQSDKWSKMGIASFSQVLVASFLPVLSQVQDDPERYARSVAKINRFTAYLLFPAVGLLAVVSAPLFHCLFGTKWDPSIVLFQLLLLRGVFTVLCSLYNNYMLSVGNSRMMIYTELIRDVAALVAILVTLPYIAETLPGDPVKGVRVMLWGQVIASVLTWGVTLWFTARATGIGMWKFVADMIPYVAIATVAMAVSVCSGMLSDSHWMLVVIQPLAGMATYAAINYVLHSRIQADAIQYLFGRISIKLKFRKTAKKQ